MKNLSLLICWLIAPLMSFSLYAQEWKWGDDEKTAKEKYALFTDNEGGDAFAAAKEPLEWLLTNTPDLNLSLYIKGIRVYENLANAEQNEELKASYQDKVLELHDKRISLFNDDRANVLNRKGYYYFKYKYQDPAEYPKMYDFYQEVIKLNGAQTYTQNLTYFIHILCQLKDMEQLTEEDVLSGYDKIIAVIDANENNSTWQQARDYVDRTLTNCVTLDCNFVNNVLAPKIMNAEKCDVGLAKRFVSASFNAECGTDNPAFLKANLCLFEAEPTHATAVILGLLYGKKNDDANQKKFLLKALELASNDEQKLDANIKLYGATKNESYLSEAQKYANDPKQKAQLNMQLAIVKSQQGLKSQARELALNSGANAYDVYTFIGNLYLNSSDECRSDSPVKSKLYAIAAYNAYKQAGNNDRAAMAQKYFPTKEEVFVEGLQNQTLPVGCWIGGTVTLPY